MAVPANKKHILITDRLSQDAFLTLNSQDFLKISRSPNPHLQGVDLSDVHALLIRSRTRIDREVFKRAKSLQVIMTSTSGFDHIDLEAAKEWGVTVMYTPTANIESAAQLTWSLVLACANKLMACRQQMKTGAWDRDQLWGVELARKTYGIIGLGRIGSRVAEFAQTFDMDVIAYDPYIEDADFRASKAERVAYEEILKRADILSFHVPRTKETERMLTRSQFEFINRGLILINTSRGSVIDEGDAIEALEKGWIGMLGLDVFEKEPLAKSSKLLQLPNVVLTPHVGANTQEAFAKASDLAAMRLIRFFMDGSTEDTLPPKAAWYGAPVPFSEANT